MFGGTGNDVLTGGAGGDQLTGVQADDERPGTGEIDSLSGGAGADRFVLGNINKNFYADFPDSGIDDYAIIEDFEAGVDTIRVGSPVTFRDAGTFPGLENGPIPGGVAISINDPSQGTELIGIVRDATIDEVMAAIIEV